MPLFWETIIGDVTRLRIGGKVLPLVTFLPANDDCSIILETLTRHSITFPSSRKKELSVLFVSLETRVSSLSCYKYCIKEMILLAIFLTP